VFWAAVCCPDLPRPWKLLAATGRCTAANTRTEAKSPFGTPTRQRAFAQVNRSLYGPPRHGPANSGPGPTRGAMGRSSAPPRPSPQLSFALQPGMRPIPTVREKLTCFGGGTWRTAERAGKAKYAEKGRDWVPEAASKLAGQQMPIYPGGGGLVRPYNELLQVRQAPVRFFLFAGFGAIPSLPSYDEKQSNFESEWFDPPSR